MHLLTAAPLLLALYLLAIPQATSEPWISNRLSQNCAGCHAPGRINKPAVGRRCTLSCRGCHTNPNGGGIRNSYGKWNQKRWMKSFDWKLGHSKELGSQVRRLANDGAIPAPLKRQRYYKREAVFADEDPDGSANSPAAEGPKPKTKRVAKRKKSYKPVRTRVLRTRHYREKDYDKYADTNWQRTARSLDEFLSTVPLDDPYFRERLLQVDGGGDLRYLYGNIDTEIKDADSGNITKAETDLSFLMAVDFGVRVKPIVDYLTVVTEGRFLNAPQNGVIEQGFTSLSQIRTAYALVDNLPFNTWVMGGIYKPMFGHQTPDHESLAADVSGFTQFSTNKAVGIGGSPNVPFFNIHAIFPMKEHTLSAYKNTRAFNAEKGIAASAGLRFVTAGFSVALSYWSTEDEVSEIKRRLYSVHGGAKFGRFIYNYEFLRSSFENGNGQKDAGNVITNEFKYRLYREMYFAGSYALSNVTRSRNKGSANEYSAGLKLMIFGGMEVDIMYFMRNQMQDADPDRPIALVEQEVNSKQFTTQLHFYF